ncbi:glyoxylate/hydroxypyruvate reductase A [uncultured Paracoccus sp.]|uniref:2-hydroxyacid dehydrogenase n=1 Tax=uncultured Paracoccus sp. TaxID=189685 RepID=UPI00261BDA66|nr:glyoxylate/hydroxypyruvate reductase A [uncultured Paracoccus sp.]
MRVLFAAPARMWDEWAPHLRAACPDIDLRRDGPPESFDALIYAPGFPETGEPLDFGPYTRARVVQSLWAGVERIVDNPTLTQPLCRMVDPGLTQGMVEYCIGWTLRAHLQMDVFAQDGVWRHELSPPLASQRKVTVLGTGALGSAVAGALAGLDFDVTGWSASGRPVQGIRVLAGEQLDSALARAEILICLLPDTPATRDVLDADRLATLPRDATVINPGRGTLIVDDALIAALDSGHLRHAVLDVFRTEPLPSGHPFWAHPRVTITPHVAAETRPSSAARVVAENLRRAMSAQPLLHLVERQRGY